MAEIIRNWLRSRLGVIIDLRPDMFGRYCRDGTFLAKLLHSYDIINHNQLQTIIQTSDPALARVNLRHLRCWLRFIGVDCNDKCIEDISNAKGTESLRLFYKVFLCLESKDRLHFITLQREREKYIPTSTKFDVKVVSEEVPIGDLIDHPLAATLGRDSASLTSWHRKKFQKIIDDCKLEREKFCASQASKESIKIPIINNKCNILQLKDTLKKNKMAKLDEFTEKHQVKSTNDYQSISQSNIKERSKIVSRHTTAFGDPQAAKQFMQKLKNRKSSMNAMQNFKIQMQKTLLNQVWEKMEHDQEREFDRIIAKKILDQSQYEKQMIKKLCDVRNQKNRITANRKLVDELMLNTQENEMRTMEEISRETQVRENEEISDEYRRMNELHQRIKLAKQRRIHQKVHHSVTKIVRDIVDISMKVAEFKFANDNYIPLRIWNELMILFLNNLPIFDLTSDYDYREEEYNEEHADIELLKRNILNECDFENYHLIKSPWSEFMPVLDDQIKEYLTLGSIVLGHIIHKLFQMVYSPTLTPITAPLPDVKIRSIVIGIPDSSFYSSLRELLKYKKIKLFTVDDAINYCLYFYKEEVKEFNYVDVNIENKSVKTSVTNDIKRQSKKQKKGERKSEKRLFDRQTDDKNVDKQTQTPKMIPYDDIHPELSDTAYIGKWAHEILANGDPIPDDLTARIIAQYLKNLFNIRGWVLSNYPQTHKQMMDLEILLTGRKIPNQSDKSNQLILDEIIHEIDHVSPRTIFTPEDNESCASCYKSELLPNPVNAAKSSSLKTYLTSFIKMLPKTKETANISDEELCELRPKDKTSIDNFYINEGILSAVYYTTCDHIILKRVVKLIFGEISSLPRISLIELSKDVSLNSKSFLENQSDNKKSPSKVQIKLSSRSIIKPPSVSQSSGEVKIVQNESEILLIKPGESFWVWADVQILPEIIENLVHLWENLEDAYIDGLKEILALKRIKFAGIIPYRDFITRHMTEFISRPDNRQELIHQFQVIFNNIPIDMRDDSDVKCELHCRIEDFQTELWNICDIRRREAEEERIRIMNDHWTAMEVIILMNIYIGIIQVEMDRFIDSIQLIQNYYLSMLKRSIDEQIISKIKLHKFCGENNTSNTWNYGISLDESKSFETPPLSDSNESNLKYEINNIISNIDKTIKINVTDTTCFKFIQSNINYVQSLIDTIFISAMEILQREDNVMLSKRSLYRKTKRRNLENRLSELSNRSSESKILENQKIQNLLYEWRYALMYEVNRIRMKLLILEAAKNTDIEFLLNTIQCAFTSMHHIANEKYKYEMKNVDDIIQIFSLAVEREVAIQEEIVMDRNNISIRPYCLMYPDNIEESFNSVGGESIKNLEFTVDQLKHLKDNFQRVAPSGFISERAFIYILQDLIICPDESHEILPLPSFWYNLNPNDIVELVHDLFGDISYIDWREFLIYSMEIQMPTQDDLLNVKEAFEQNDHDITGIISRKHFILQSLWFPTSPQISFEISSLYNNFEKDEYEMSEEEFDSKNWRIVLDSKRNLQKSKKSISSHTSNLKEIDSQYSGELDEQNLMRMTLIKELLCEMYLNSYYTVNFMAMLLGFCKDENPIYGFGKALSLALGKRVCLDFDEGEKYVNKLLEERRLLNDEQIRRMHREQDATEFSSKYLIEVIERAMNLSDRAFVEVENFSSAKIEDTFQNFGAISIEKLDQPDKTIDSAISLYRDDTDLSASIEGADVPSLSIKSEELIIKSKEQEAIYWLPLNVCETVLSALIPFNVIQDYISGTEISLTENLRRIYQSVACNELNYAMEDTALSHRIVHHPFIKSLLQCTTKFTNKNLKSIVEKFLINKRNSR